MPYSHIPYYPPDERTLTQAEIDENWANLAEQQTKTLKQAIGSDLFNLLELTEDTRIGKIRKNK